MRPQPPLPPAGDTTRYVAFVSGLALGDAASDPSRVSLLLDFLTGMLGAPPEQATSAQASPARALGGFVRQAVLQYLRQSPACESYPVPNPKP